MPTSQFPTRAVKLTPATNPVGLLENFFSLLAQKRKGHIPGPWNKGSGEIHLLGFQSNYTYVAVPISYGAFHFSLSLFNGNVCFDRPVLYSQVYVGSLVGNDRGVENHICYFTGICI